jgi:hypothetical protein
MDGTEKLEIRIPMEMIRFLPGTRSDNGTGWQVKINGLLSGTRARPGR